MKVLLTSANDYTGKRLLRSNHEVLCAIRDKNCFNQPLKIDENVTVAEVNSLNTDWFHDLSSGIDGDYYLPHGLSSDSINFEEMEDEMVTSVRGYSNKRGVKKVIYLGGITGEA